MVCVRVFLLVNFKMKKISNGYAPLVFAILHFVLHPVSIGK